MTARLAGRVVVITGAARGQGAAEAELFAAEGARVVLTDILDDEGAAVAAKIGPAARFLHHDVRSEEDWSRVFARARAEFGKVDGLVNNAGIAGYNTLERTTLAQYLDMVQTNQVGVFLGIRAAIPAMREAGGGSIVNVASIAGLSGMPSMSAYAATKFAVIGMTRSAAMELGPVGIRLNAVCPGLVETTMSTSVPHLRHDRLTRAIPLRRSGSAREIADLALFLVSAESSYCTGAEFVADGGRLAGTPLT
ncbi:glucose 1-dehydrogenase [Kutzneria viridogrisea]|uniref:3alpha(Or 20beta)-hydroxysteroid dehydrogenase n=1 Tax=Kutzneria viridogrisea TaxID=47990 RepID=A0ABR6BAJ3_9PSEU|nr:3alpha(or 20beta)-hydroxysteroid dehydrogenase [Kutzneria viridogrisea]